MRGNPGKIVIIKGGKRGRTFNVKGLINGKVPVYLEQDDKPLHWHEQAILCDPKTMTIIGHID